MESKNNKVVITGIGPVSSLGSGVECLWSGLLSGQPDIHDIPASFGNEYHFNSRFYVPFPAIDGASVQVPKKFECLMEKSSLATLIASRLALRDAGIGFGEQMTDLPVDPSECAIILGTGICPLRTGFDAFASHAIPGSQRRFNRMVIPMTMTDAPSAWVSILNGINGPSWTLNASCASGTLAIGEAFQKIKDGKISMAIAGGVECLEDPSGTIMRGFDCLGTLTTSPDGRPMPFSSKRSGFLFAEGGACVLILESYEKAIARGADPYAEILDYNSNSDAFNIVQMNPNAVLLKKLIENWVLNENIDYFNAHGTGTVLNDETEALLIQSFYKNRESQPLVNSTKGILGHTIGASGAFEAAVCALSIHDSVIHGNLTESPFENIKIPTENIRQSIRRAISVSYGFGGHNAALLLGKI